MFVCLCLAGFFLPLFYCIQPQLSLWNIGVALATSSLQLLPPWKHLHRRRQWDVTDSGGFSTQ